MGGVGLGWRILKVFKEGIYDVYVYIYMFISDQTIANL